ncbi:MAG: CoA pyrophosphatase [Bacillota bacterium]
MPHDAIAPARKRLGRDAIVARLRTMPPAEQLLTEDDVERRRLNDSGALKPAAVLLLLVNHDAGPSIVFTQRTLHLADHAGQISFPGGRFTAEDGTPERTALREAEEEIGISPARIEVLGRLPEYNTSTGYLVTPVVGWIEPPVSYRPDPHEVDEVFEVPLEFLVDTRNHRYESAFYRGALRRYWAMPYGERFIWGATAAMLVTFARVLAFDPGAA